MAGVGVRGDVGEVEGLDCVLDAFDVGGLSFLAPGDVEVGDEVTETVGFWVNVSVSVEYFKDEDLPITRAMEVSGYFLMIAAMESTYFLYLLRPSSATWYSPLDASAAQSRLGKS